MRRQLPTRQCRSGANKNKARAQLKKSKESDDSDDATLQCRSGANKSNARAQLKKSNESDGSDDAGKKKSNARAQPKKSKESDDSDDSFVADHRTRRAKRGRKNRGHNRYRQRNSAGVPDPPGEAAREEPKDASSDDGNVQLIPLGNPETHGHSVQINPSGAVIPEESDSNQRTHYSRAQSENCHIARPT